VSKVTTNVESAVLVLTQPHNRFATRLLLCR